MAYVLALATVSLLAAANSVAGGPIAAATSTPQQLTETAAVADALGIADVPLDAPSTADRQLLEQLAVSRAQRDASQAAAAATQVQAEEAA
ncbi:MAG: hypothetical protein M3P89_13745, partial [Actinomycetota bacterium]|nr:hypothetical protein [Actinomycetota bacterium]